MMNSTWAGQMGPTSALPTFAQRRQAVQDLQLRRQAAQNELLLLKSTSDALSSSPETTQAVEEKLEAVSDKLAEGKSQTVRLPPQERFDRFEPGQEVPSSGLYQVRRSASGYQVLFDPCAQ